MSFEDGEELVPVRIPISEWFRPTSRNYEENIVGKRGVLLGAPDDHSTETVVVLRKRKNLTGRELPP